MSSQEFLWLNVGIALIVALIFLWRRKSQRQPSRLNLKKTTDSRSAMEPLMDKSTKESQGPQAKNLNVVFVYNGHPWDAHEILGVPAGASLEACEKAYKETLAKADQQSRLFVETAYKAIVADYKSRI